MTPRLRRLAHLTGLFQNQVTFVLRIIGTDEKYLKLGMSVRSF